MRYSILVFNQKPMAKINPVALAKRMQSSSFLKLCDQYGVDQALIQPALLHLEVKAASKESFSYFILSYQPQPKPPIVVSHWELTPSEVEQRLSEIKTNLSAPVYDELINTAQLYSIELTKPQLKDMGLLFAYELARYLAEQNSGLVYGLDRCWYRLNSHRAFIPVAGNIG